MKVATFFNLHDGHHLKKFSTPNYLFKLAYEIGLTFYIFANNEDISLKFDQTLMTVRALSCGYIGVKCIGWH